MAKTTKKSVKAVETETKSTVAKNAAPKKSPQKPPEKKPASKPNLMGGGLIDSGLLASSAANFMRARAKGRHQMTSASSVGQIKSDLAKPASAVAGEFLDQQSEGTGGRRSNLPTGQGAPRGQTVGHAAQRTSVPRRTAG
mgnify:CR=1 FL=1